jgi:DNA polymerase III subunit epsilon
LYAIIDLETTGGQPLQDKITEIAIFIHDGEKIVDQYNTLINPQRPIPFFITQLTGITDEMVQEAPKFYEVAKDIVQLTEGKIFVAHNVRFDYSFLKKEFADLGYTYQRKTLCTVRLSRTLLPGLASYSLGKLCKSINIDLKMRHRAIGDAEATAELFDRLLKLNQKPINGVEFQQEASEKRIKSEVKTSLLPPQLKQETLLALPDAAGVYYFHDEKGEVIYVGKSISIRKRVASHFNIDLKSKKSLEFKNRVADISYTLTGSELVALLYESEEIKRLKPHFNRQQRRSIFTAGIYVYLDQNGYKRLTYNKISQGQYPIVVLSNHFKAKNFLFHKVAKYNLCQKLCDLYKTNGACFDYQVQQCLGACLGLESPESYNARVDQAIESLSYDHDTFVVIGDGREPGEKSVVGVQNGRYLGFGFFDESFSAKGFQDFKDVLKPYLDNKDVQQIIRGYLRIRHKDQVIVFESDSGNPDA